MVYFSLKCCPVAGTLVQDLFYLFADLPKNCQDRKITLFSRTGLSFASVGTVSTLKQLKSGDDVRMVAALPVVGAVCRRHFSRF
jgi:hypothetical protein